MIGVRHRNGRVIHGVGLQRAWVPWRDPSCIEWWAADQGVSQAANAVTSWKGRKGTLLTGVGSPLYTPSDSAFAGHSTVSCTVPGQSLYNASFSPPDGSSVFAIAQAPPLQTYNRELFDAYSAGRRLIAYGTSGNIIMYSGTPLTTAASYSSGSVLAICASFAGSSSAMYVNSSTAASSGACGSSTITGVVVGNSPSGYFYEQPWGAPMHAIGFFKGSPSANSLKLFLQYAKTRCGVVIS